MSREPGEAGSAHRGGMERRGCTKTCLTRGMGEGLVVGAGAGGQLGSQAAGRPGDQAGDGLDGHSCWSGSREKGKDSAESLRRGVVSDPRVAHAAQGQVSFFSTSPEHPPSHYPRSLVSVQNPSPGCPAHHHLLEQPRRSTPYDHAQEGTVPLQVLTRPAPQRCCLGPSCTLIQRPLHPYESLKAPASNQP